MLENKNNSMIEDKIFSNCHIKKHKNVAVAIMTRRSETVIVHRYNVCAEKIYKYIFVSLGEIYLQNGISQMFKPLDMQVCFLRKNECMFKVKNSVSECHKILT